MRGFPDVRCVQRFYIQLVEVTSGMHVDQPGTHIASLASASGQLSTRAAGSFQFLNGVQVMAIAFIAGVTWLALLGAGLGWSVVGEGATSTLAAVLPRTAGSFAYDMNQPVPTRFGSMSLTAVDLGAGGASEPWTGGEPLAPPDKVQVQVSLSLSNERDGTVWSPSVEEFRLVSSGGAEAEPLGRLWAGPAILYPHSNNSMRLGFLAPRDGSALWLEYRASPSESPVRIALGTPEAFGETDNL
jgi:hypothetical protein